MFLSAQVPCKEIILHARASKSKKIEVQRLAAISLSHSEAGVHKVLSESGCKLDVPLDFVDLPTQKAVPYVKMSNWIQFLGQTERLHYLVGTSNGKLRQELCKEFWHRWSCIRPNHPIFCMARENKLRLEDCIPILHHGDEGRTYRRMPIMIISSHGLLGKGCKQSKIKKDLPVAENPMFLNFLGSTVTTHYIFCALPHTLYKNCPEALDLMLQLYANDAKDVATKGVDITEDGATKRLHFWTVGVKGDLPYLGRAGQFTRSFSNCPKKSFSKKASTGICWQCSAGDERLDIQLPWEDFRSTARWMGSIGANPGYSSSAPLLTIPHDNGYELYRADLWHVFHLGCGKSFSASAIVVLLDTMEGSMDSNYSG